MGGKVADEAVADKAVADAAGGDKEQIVSHEVAGKVPDEGAGEVTDTQLLAKFLVLTL